MLVLSRKTGESIVIDGGIKVTVLSATKNGIKLGIDAPKNIGVRREEIERLNIVHRLSAGESLGDIEMELDWEDNRETANRRAATKAAS
jgi:carbon storage regulator